MCDYILFSEVCQYHNTTMHFMLYHHLVNKVGTNKAKRWPNILDSLILFEQYWNVNDEDSKARQRISHSHSHLVALWYLWSFSASQQRWCRLPPWGTGLWLGMIYNHDTHLRWNPVPADPLRSSRGPEWPAEGSHTCPSNKSAEARPASAPCRTIQDCQMAVHSSQWKWSH